jgi:hypothetical protein
VNCRKYEKKDETNPLRLFLKIEIFFFLNYFSIKIKLSKKKHNKCLYLDFDLLEFR